MTALDESGTQTPRGSILGTRVQRTEDPEFLTTGAVYTEDLVDERLAGARAGHLRPLARRARADHLHRHAPQALAAPGCRRRLHRAGPRHPAQQPPLPMYDAVFAQPLLADGVVRFVGEPVAVVLTDDRYAGEDAAELVDVDYDPLPAVVDLKAALAGETLLFPDVRHEPDHVPARPSSPTTSSPTARSSSRRRSSTSGWPSRRSRCARPPPSGATTAG